MTSIQPDIAFRYSPTGTAGATQRSSARKQIVHSDVVYRVAPGTRPDYNSGNPLVKLLGLMQRTQLAAERECYPSEQLQYLFPFDQLSLYGPTDGNADLLDPTQQDDRTDFQKQNVRDFLATDTFLIRGWVTVGDWSGPFLRLSYRGGPDSHLSAVAHHRLGERVKVWLRIGSIGDAKLVVPYNPASDRYEVELWGYQGDIRPRLGPKARAALDRGELQLRPDLIRGDATAFARESLSGLPVMQIALDHAMHPVLPLHVEVAWTDETETAWDSQFGQNYHYEFNMLLRGWDNYLGVGMSPNPHGGVGFLEYRNLFSNYGQYARSGELGRIVEPWSFDAYGRKDGQGARAEDFLAVEYMDLHILRPSCGIGLHRHRDNQEAFLMLDGQGYMVVGDWCKPPERERCLEVRTLRAGHLAMLKGGNLHGLMNPSDEDLSLFMFGGYD